MEVFARVIDEKSKKCEIGLGSDKDFYQSIGMIEMEVEQAYDGCWYLCGFAPEKTVEKMQEEVRKVRNQLLEQTDKFLLADYPITDSEREQYKAYRQYLRDYTQDEGWYLHNPMTLDEWKINTKPVEE